VEIMKILLLVMLVLFLSAGAVSNKTVAPIEPSSGEGIYLLGFTFKNGNIYVLKGEVLPGSYYFDGSTRRDRHKRIWCEIYVARWNKIVLYKTINAKIIPATPETWEFDEQAKKEIRR
jgi:hypothetical protein